jgi:hypothetical protein
VESSDLTLYRHVKTAKKTLKMSSKRRVLISRYGKKRLSHGWVSIAFTVKSLDDISVVNSIGINIARSHSPYRMNAGMMVRWTGSVKWMSFGGVLVIAASWISASVVYVIRVRLLVGMEILYYRSCFFYISEGGFATGHRARDIRLDQQRNRYSNGFMDVVKEGLDLVLRRHLKRIYWSLLGYK